MSRGRLVVHAHFYQPSRVDPFGGPTPTDPAAAPFPDWTSRIAAECYRPNAERGTIGRISFDVGPTLAAWLAEHDPATWAAYVRSDRPGSAAVTLDDPPGDDRPGDPPPGEDPPPGTAPAGRAMAQGFHHSILPLASAADRLTEIRWGLREFLFRFGRPAAGLWLPETAVDLPTLRLLARQGVRYTILAPWQADRPQLDTRRPYRVELGDGLDIVVAFYDTALSAAVSFEPGATADADRFARERVAARLAGTPFPDGTAGLVIIATDGELYGHHQPFRDLFLEHLVAPEAEVGDRGFDVVDLGTALEEPPGRRFPTVRIRERTSWSCHHGVLRWSGECPDAPDGRWKAPLRVAFDRLAAGIDAVTERTLAELGPGVDLWAARDAYVDVVVGAEPAERFAGRWLGDAAPPDEVGRLLALLEAQRWRLAMFASDAWFWDDPIRVETRQALRSAARAVRLVDAATGAGLERRLVDDLALLHSPAIAADGAAIYGRALEEVGQPRPDRGHLAPPESADEVDERAG